MVATARMRLWKFSVLSENQMCLPLRALDPSEETWADRFHSPNMLLSGSRDKTLIIWNLTRDETSYGYPKRSLHGHSHIVSDCVRRTEQEQE